jgi:hypothetical protein
MACSVSAQSKPMPEEHPVIRIDFCISAPACFSAHLPDFHQAGQRFIGA